MRLETRGEIIKVSRGEQQKMVDVTKMLKEVMDHASDYDLKCLAKLGYDTIRNLHITYVELDPNIEPPNAGH